MPQNKKQKFQCPECSSKKSADEMLVSTIYTPGDPWSAVLQTITCGQCGAEIPAHLAERWDGISVEEAKKEWLEKYRDTPSN